MRKLRIRAQELGLHPKWSASILTVCHTATENNGYKSSKSDLSSGTLRIKYRLKNFLGTYIYKPSNTYICSKCKKSSVNFKSLICSHYHECMGFSATALFLALKLTLGCCLLFFFFFNTSIQV